MNFLKEAKKLIRKLGFKKLLAKLLQKLPISSETLGPPKGVASLSHLLGIPGVEYEQCSKGYCFSYRAFPLFHLYNKHARPADEKGLQYHYFEPTYTLKIPEGRVLAEKGLVVSPQDFLISNFTLEFSVPINEHPIFNKRKLAKLQYLDERLAVIAFTGARCYYHWLFDILPRFELLRRSGFEVDKYYVPPLERRFQQESYEALNLNPHQFIYSDKKTHIKAKALIVPSLPATVTKIPPFVCEFLRSTFLKEKPKRKDRRLYLSRSGTGYQRQLTNEDRLSKELETLGFEKVLPEQLTIAEQAQLFSEASIIISQHGAALSNTVFCERQTQVIEIFSPNYLCDCYWFLSQQMGLEHHAMLASQEGLSQEQIANWDAKLSDENFEMLFKIIEQKAPARDLNNPTNSRNLLFQGLN